MAPKAAATTDIVLIVILSLLGGLYAVYNPPEVIPAVEEGICFPSPGQWGIAPVWGKTLNLALIFLLAICIYLINRTFGIIRTAMPLMASIFLPLCCGNIFISGELMPGTFVLALTLLSTATLLNSYRSRNATRSVFLAATYISIGSMFCYAFLLMAIALFPAIAEMKTGRWREYAALIGGLISPYWILIGLGIVNPLEFHPEMPQSVFTSQPDTQLFTMTVCAGVLLLATILLNLSNTVKLYAGNGKTRNFNNVVNYFGIAAAAGMIFDYRNIMAYICVFNLWSALQLANIFTLRQLRRPEILFRFIMLLIFGGSAAIAFV